MRLRAVRKAVVTGGLALLGIGLGLGVTASAAGANELPGTECLLTNVVTPDPYAVTAGSLVTVSFTVPDGCVSVQLSLASYTTPYSGPFDPATIEQQVLFDSETGFYTPGTYTMTVDVPVATTTPGTSHPDCSVQHDNSPGRGANQSPGPYDNTCNGSASQNGVGGGNANGRPCAGCVGNADDKNPPGQYPNGSDHNAGYECDRNQGIGQTNPAHTGCSTGFQVDFAYGPVIPQLSLNNMYGIGKIWSANG